MMKKDSSNTSELDELKALRAQKELLAQKERELINRQLEADQKLQEKLDEEKREIAREIIEDKRVQARRDKELDKIYNAGELPPMPLVQKIILVVVVLILLVVILYILDFY
ncbi:MAG: hypothetical protein Q4E22_00805, partial [Coriobacteriia bacterium]|nr:hypothetical protein [Coriobacteriia bacterium]